MPPLLFVWIALGAAGLLGLALALRGRRVGDAPHCRKCGFELTGLSEETSVCPECGRSLAARRAIRVGARRKRPWLGAVSGLALLLALGGASLSVEEIANAAIRRLPASALVMLAENGNGTALDELGERLKDNNLGESEIRALTDATLARQGDRNRPFDGAWKDMLATLHRRDLLTEEQLVTCLRNAAEIDVTLRKKVYPDRRFRCRIGMDVQRLPDAFASRPIMLDYRLTSITFNGEELETQRGRYTKGETPELRTSSAFYPGHRGASTHAIGFTEPLDLGTHTVRTVVTCRLSDGNGTEGDGDDGGTWTREQTHTVTVVPEGTEVISRIDTPEAREEVRSTISVAPLGVIDHAPEDTYSAAAFNGTVRSEPRDTPVAYDIFALLPDGRRYRITSYGGPPVTTDGSESSFTVYRNTPEDGLPHPGAYDWPERIDLLFVPSADAAYEAPAIDEICDVELRFEDVPVVRSADPSKWTPPSRDRFTQPVAAP